MILLYGAGGVPGRGESPMDLIRNRAADDVPLCMWGGDKLHALTKAHNSRKKVFRGNNIRNKVPPWLIRCVF